MLNGFKEPMLYIGVVFVLREKDCGGMLGNRERLHAVDRYATESDKTRGTTGTLLMVKTSH